jgi:hypothetical protein
MTDTTHTVPSRRSFLAFATAAAVSCFVKPETTRANTQPLSRRVTDAASYVAMWRSYGAEIVDQGPFGLAVYYDKANCLPREAIVLEAEWKAKTPDWACQVRQVLNA